MGLVTSLLHLTIKIHLKLFVNKLRTVKFTITYMTLNCAKEMITVEKIRKRFSIVDALIYC